MTPKETFYHLLPCLHAFGALLAAGLSLACDTGKAQQTARVPRLIPGQVQHFPQAFPWDEGAEFATHTWNPFALIVLFEWLTAGFALRPLAYYHSPRAILWVWLAWLALGLVLFLVWTATNSGGPCVAMLCLGALSFLASAGLALAYILLPGPIYTQSRAAHPEKALRYMDRSGRVWNVLSGEHKQEATENEFETGLGVAFRYGEYCITAPLLFLAVVCLLTTDGPAWLYLGGYWLLFVCNALGVALHLSFCGHDSRPRGLLDWLIGLLCAGSWWVFCPLTCLLVFHSSNALVDRSDARSNQASLLQAAWACLLLPVCGLIFVTRGYLLSAQLPALAQFMIWNLLVTYCLFGIVPSFVYATRLGARQLPWLLDVLNVLAKFPLPLVVLAGFITRPASTKFCVA